MKEKAAAIVVTYNRKDILIECLAALLHQTFPLDLIYIIDNASTDGTYDYLNFKGLLNNPTIKYVRLNENIGGAGGFHNGMKLAYEEVINWMWIMDDDCIPQEDAHENLVKARHLKANSVYGSVAVSQTQPDTLVWHTDILFNNCWKPCRKLTDFNNSEIARTKGIGFLGLYINRETVKIVGFPNKEFFIWADDVDYYFRITRDHNFKMFYVTNSIIRHPAPEYREINLYLKTITHVSAPAWKVYYGIRNNVFITKKYEKPLKFYLWRIPKRIVVVLLIILFLENDQKWKRLNLYLKAIYDGARGILGKKDF